MQTFYFFLVDKQIKISKKEQHGPKCKSIYAMLLKIDSWLNISFSPDNTRLSSTY